MCTTPEPHVPPPQSAAPAAKKTFSDNWSGAGRFADDEPLPLSFWLLGPSPRRGILTSLGIWGLIAPATNLWGIGSFLLSLAPDVAREAQLDTFYPISERRFYPYAQGYLDYSTPGAFKRYVDETKRFEFRYPATYVQDQAIYMRNLDAATSRRMMDPTLAATAQSRTPSRRSQQGVAVAVGPQGGTGDENLSFEYRVEYTSEAQPPSYTICVVGAARGSLYTFASRVPAAVWEERASELREAASSFVLLG
ncbi:photosystem ii reaction center family protein [Chrysochromulina tobinii]|uniref:Photosystem ii reaction center family protein n=1 Tax=Chrysochromulina tobinii TaxID=1460289 RepID=A0A0M0J4I3_9EUKA|nr:photosystem ii reaction center family protein [Chrysochromulina tobinii]|eukprot:KOO21509.1 photosystem ii reaction center family protein [Chrysochromulina sp. CCMP291]